MPAPRAHATSVIDFGLADRTNAVYDIAQAIERNIVEWLELVRDPGRMAIESLCTSTTCARCSTATSECARSATQKQLRSPRCSRSVTRSSRSPRLTTFSGSALAGESAHRNPRLPRGTRAVVPRPGRQKLLDPLRRWAESRDNAGGRAHDRIRNRELSGRALGGTRGLHHHCVGIWLTTKRLLICWPVVLAADFSIWSSFTVRACSLTHCSRSSSSPSRFMAGGIGGAVCARRAKCA